MKRGIRSVVLIIPDDKRYVVSFPKAPFNIVLAIARTKALYMLAWNGTRSSSVPCNAAYTRCIYVNARTDIVRLYWLPVILTISCRTFAFAATRATLIRHTSDISAPRKGRTGIEIPELVITSTPIRFTIVNYVRSVFRVSIAGRAFLLFGSQPPIFASSRARKSRRCDNRK